MRQMRDLSVIWTLGGSMSFSYLLAKHPLSLDAVSMGVGAESPRLLSEKELVGLCRAVRESPAHVLVLCAESGMGKSFAINCLTCDEQAQGGVVYNVSLAGSSECDAPARLTRFARDVIARAEARGRLVVTIDDVPAGDEGAIAREVRAIRKIVSAGACVVMSLRPEASALAEAIDGATVVGPARLAARAGSPDDVVTKLSNCVPQLVAAMRDDAVASGRVSIWGRSYSSALIQVIGSALRPTLPEEDLRLRLAMILLGRGTLDDLRAVDRRIDDEMLAWLEREAPLFGCSCATRTFSVAGVDDCEALMDVYGALTVPCGPRQALVASCAEVLAMRGEYRRSGLVCGLCPDARESHALALAWGTEYVCAGMPKVVSRGIEARHDMILDEEMGLFSDGEAGDGIDAGVAGVAGKVAEKSASWVAADALSAWVLAELSAKVDELSDARGCARALCSESTVPTCALRRAKLIGVCRRVLAEVSEGERACASIEDDEFSAQLVTHASVLCELARGRVSSAFKELVNGGARAVVDGLPSAWLSDDLRACEVLLGERDLRQGDADQLRVEHVFRTVSSRRIDLYRAAEHEALEVLMGRRATFGAGERASGRAAEYGDVLVEAALLFVAAIADLRGGACTRAYVRAERSRSRALAAGSPFVAQAALLVQVGARASLGEDVSLVVDEMERGPMRDLARLFERSLRADRTRPVRFDALSRGTCPRDVLWALNMLMYDCGDASLAFRGSLPSAWRSFACHVFEERLGSGPVEEPRMPGGVAGAGDAACAASAGVEGGARATRTRPGAKRVLVSVLGSFSVRVDGVPVASSALTKRKARDVITALALARGHKMVKRDLVMAIWGDCDFATGSQRLYEAVASTRKLLRGGDPKSNPVISNRYSGTVALVSEEIAFDIDEFERAAMQALMSEGDDRRTVRYAVQAHQIFGAGVEVVPADLNGEIVSHVQELALAHADACLVGSQAALREGKDYLAVELARASLANDELREDAVKCLVVALGVQGRRSEIVELYERYRMRLRERFGRAPGSGLDDVVREILSDGETPWVAPGGPAAARELLALEAGATASSRGLSALASAADDAGEDEALLGGEGAAGTDAAQEDPGAGEKSVRPAAGDGRGKRAGKGRKASAPRARKASKGHGRASGKRSSGGHGHGGGRVAGGASA